MVAFVKHFQGLWRLGRERRPTRQTLEHDRTQTPQVRFGIVLKGHDHFGSLKQRKCLKNIYVLQNSAGDKKEDPNDSGYNRLTMYIGEPQSVAAMTPS